MSEATAHSTSIEGGAASNIRSSWTEPYPDRPVPFWTCVREDVLAQVPPDQRNRSFPGWLRVVLASPSVRVTFCYRLSYLLKNRMGFVGKVLGTIVHSLTYHWYCCEISPHARIYGGLVLPHPFGVLVGPGAVIGPRAWLFKDVTIGGGAGRGGMPRVGADCRIFTGAVIVGPITIGDEVAVSPNTLVQRNVPDQCLVVGVPGNVFPRSTKPKP